MAAGEIVLTFTPTIEEAQLGAIAATNVAAAYFEMVVGTVPGPNNAFIDALEMALGEACSNTVKHRSATALAAPQVRVLFTLEGEQLAIQIEDGNTAFDFANILPPDFDAAPEDGYGIFLMKSCMDEVHYLRRGEHNVLLLKKLISAGVRL